MWEVQGSVEGSGCWRVREVQAEGALRSVEGRAVGQRVHGDLWRAAWRAGQRGGQMVLEGSCGLTAGGVKRHDRQGHLGMRCCPLAVWAVADLGLVAVVLSVDLKRLCRQKPHAAPSSPPITFASPLSAPGFASPALGLRQLRATRQ